MEAADTGSEAISDYEKRVGMEMYIKLYGFWVEDFKYQRKITI